VFACTSKPTVALVPLVAGSEIHDVPVLAVHAYGHAPFERVSPAFHEPAPAPTLPVVLVSVTVQPLGCETVWVWPPTVI